jgi:hypothetical protein
MYAVLQETSGQMEYLHENGELSKVIIEQTGMWTRKIRVANLPQEANDRVIRDTLPSYCEFKNRVK